jgi:hypothetical protein
VWWTFARSAFPWFVPINILLVLLTQYAQGCLEYSFCISMVVYAPIRLRMQWLEALPVPRRAFLLAALVPVVLPVAIGAAFTVAGRDVVSAAPRSGTRSVQVPLEYWRHAPGGVAPVVTAPWGETFRPKPETFLRYPLYNPYAVGPETSARFVEWQYRRAREAVSGHPFTKARMRVLYVAAVLALSLGFLWLPAGTFRRDAQQPQFPHRRHRAAALAATARRRPPAR